MDRNNLIQTVATLLVKESKKAHELGCQNQPGPIGEGEARALVERRLVKTGILPVRTKGEERAQLLARSIEDVLEAELNAIDRVNATRISSILRAGWKDAPVLKTTGDVVTQTRLQILKRPGMGKKLMQSLEKALDNLGLALKDAE